MKYYDKLRALRAWEDEDTPPDARAWASVICGLLNSVGSRLGSACVARVVPLDRHPCRIEFSGCADYNNDMDDAMRVAERLLLDMHLRGAFNRAVRIAVRVNEDALSEAMAYASADIEARRAILAAGIRCPRPADGREPAGCGSANVGRDDNDGMYDCFDCGLFFTAAECVDSELATKGKEHVD